MAQQFGYLGTYKPPRQPALAHAAVRKDPYGLAPNNRPGPYGASPLGLGASHGFAQAASTSIGGYATPGEKQLVGRVIGVPGHGGQATPPATPSTPAAPTAPPANTYDLNTDPALQQIQALLGMSDQQAQGEALKERQNLLLAYGDPNLASSVLGADDPFVAAAAQNPTSTVSQLGHQRDRNLNQLDEQLNQSNLGYSGYRVTQEQQAAQDFQNALAQAAAGVNQNLGGVDSNLLAALQSNAQSRAQAIADAADRAAAAAAQSGTDPGAADPTLAGAAGGGTGADQTGQSYVDPVTQAIIDAGLTKRQDFLNYGLRNAGMA